MWITYPIWPKYEKDFVSLHLECMTTEPRLTKARQPASLSPPYTRFANDMRPLILISNDDGYQAKGIQFLAQTLRQLGDIIVVAPTEGRSGMACACTFREPVYRALIHSEEGLEVYCCSGTPVDCVKLAISSICPRTPDIIVGGINHGDNSAINAHYSGTMGVVMEGCMKGIPSVAFSIDSHEMEPDFNPMAPYILKITKYILDKGLPKGSCLNVNCPALPSFKGMKMCRMADGLWLNEFEQRNHPRGGDYFWLTGFFNLVEGQGSEADKEAMNEGFVAVTPIHIDMTDYELKAVLEKELLN